MDLASKQYVRNLLVKGLAELIPTDEITSGPWRHTKSTKSDVWNRFGPVRVVATGIQCEGFVACNFCFKIYTFKGSSQGTSTLRFHTCAPEDIVVKQSMVVEDGEEAPKDAVGANETAWPAQAPSPGPSRKADNGPRASTSAPRPSTSGFVKNDPGTPPPMVMNPYVEQQQQQQQQQQVPRLLPKPVQQQQAQPHMRLRVRPPPMPAAPEDVDMEPEPQQVCLRWNSFHSNMQTMFPNLLNREKFVDVTLACEGRSIKCHKVVLSSCSTYLERLLSENPCKHPIILMPRDLRYWELRALVDFMYRGEVNVEHEQLSSLLAAAESLQIKGLAGPSSNLPDQQEEEERPPSPRAKRKRVSSPPPVVQRPPPLPQRPRNRPVSPPSTSDVTPRLPNSSAVSITRLAPRPPPTPVVVVTPAPERRSPGIEITPVVSFEEIKVEPVDISSNDDDLDQTQDYEMEKDYEEGEEGDEGGGSEDDGGGDDDGDPDQPSTSHSDHGNNRILETAVQNAGFGTNNGHEYSSEDQAPDATEEYIVIPMTADPGGTEDPSSKAGT